jgi:hypothetical protein
MNADGTGQQALTNNTVPDLTSNWSTDGMKIFFHRPVVWPDDGRLYNQLFVMNADGTGITQLTIPPGHNVFPEPGSGAHQIEIGRRHAAHRSSINFHACSASTARVVDVLNQD